MGLRVIGWLAVGGLILAVGGCGKKKSTAVELPEAGHKARAEQAGPTTQQLLNGPRTRIKLASLPLSLEVPKGWAISQPEGTSITFLEGPLPSGGEAHIQLTSKPSIWTDNQSPMSMNDRVSLLEEGAKKEQSEHPESIKRVDVRALGTAKVFEKESVFQPIGQLLDAQGNPVVVPLQHRWTITVFVPQDKTFATYELNFLSLSQDEYKANEGFLSKIIGSLALAK